MSGRINEYVNGKRKWPAEPILRLWPVCLSAQLIALGCAASSASRILDRTSLSSQDVRLQVTRNFHKLRSFAGQAHVIIELPGSGNRGTSEVYIQFPDSIFVKTEAMLGIDIGALFLDRRYFGAYAPRDNTLYYGETELLNLRDFLEIELTTEELYEALTGLNQIHTDSTTVVRWDDDRILLTTRRDSGEVRYWVEPKRFVVSRSELVDAAGRPVMVKEFKRFRRHGGVYLPQVIRLTRPQARERITVYYTRQRVNDKLEPEDFRLDVASNARRVYWGDLHSPKVDRRRIK